MYIV
jgi:hypothetical protein